MTSPSRKQVAALALAFSSTCAFADPTCVVVNQVGVVRDAKDTNLRFGIAFPCYLTDDEALYRYRHGQLPAQRASGLYHGFNPSTGEFE